MRIPKSPLPVAFLALTYAELGRMEEARAMAGVGAAASVSMFDTRADATAEE